MTLSELKIGDEAIVEQVAMNRHGYELANRLAALGVVENKSIRVLRKAKFGGPLHIQVGLTTEIAIRCQEADMVRVRPLKAIEVD
jgi:ferrous iron transport protein A